jgi:hypothetical protein
MKRRSTFVAAVVAASTLGVLTPAAAESFKTPSDCVAGRRVTDMLGKTGTVVGIQPGEKVMCTVKMDAGGPEQHLIFWMLHPAGGSRETNDKLVPGTYECFGNGRYTFIDVHVTGPNTYSSGGSAGTFRVEPSRNIVFLSGPLARDHGHLLPGPTIGLNTDGGTFYATTCEYKKGK